MTSEAGQPQPRIKGERSRWEVQEDARRARAIERSLALKKRFLDIGHAELTSPFPGATIGVDPSIPKGGLDIPGFIDVKGEAEHLPFQSGSMDRTIASSAYSEFYGEEAIHEMLRVLKPGATGEIRGHATDDAEAEEIKGYIRDAGGVNIRMQSKEVAWSDDPMRNFRFQKGPPGTPHKKPAPRETPEQQQAARGRRFEEARRSLGFI